MHVLVVYVLFWWFQHNPRGSNDRNCERNVNRNNGNRLFDSQNNAKGGYACPRAVGAEAVSDLWEGYLSSTDMIYEGRIPGLPTKLRLELNPLP